MFYVCDDFFSGIIFNTQSSLVARSFLRHHSDGWVYQYGYDGSVTPIFLVEDIEVPSYD